MFSFWPASASMLPPSIYIRAVHGLDWTGLTLSPRSSPVITSGWELQSEARSSPIENPAYIGSGGLDWTGPGYGLVAQIMKWKIGEMGMEKRTVVGRDSEPEVGVREREHFCVSWTSKLPTVYIFWKMVKLRRRQGVELKREEEDKEKMKVRGKDGMCDSESFWWKSVYMWVLKKNIIWRKGEEITCLCLGERENIFAMCVVLKGTHGCLGFLYILYYITKEMQ